MKTESPTGLGMVSRALAAFGKLIASGQPMPTGTRQRRYRTGASDRQVVNPAGTKLAKKAVRGTLTKCHCNKFGS